METETKQKITAGHAAVDTSTGDNPFQAVNRYKKARKIADTLRALGVLDVSPEPTEEQLTVWAGMAETHVPSLTTWALVRHLLEEGR